MKVYVPNYYADFACLKGECRHSCCIGWEIDIDATTLEAYRNTEGNIGEQLRENIAWDGEDACFRLTEAQRCPFLENSGLCRLILELGEDSLCQICADHPRFRNFFSDREEIGLGLCCEAAGKLILPSEAPFALQVLEDDASDEEPDEEEKELLELRASLIADLQRAGMPVRQRIQAMLADCGIVQTPFSIPDWASFLLKLERLDTHWGDLLAKLQQHELPQPHLSGLDAAFANFACYLLFRHLPAALDDGDLRGRIAFVALIFELVYALAQVQQACSGSFTLDDLVELARIYSSEIEYSDENIEAILDELHRLNPEL